MTCRTLTACFAVLVIFLVHHSKAQTSEEDPDFWYDKAQRELDDAINEAKGFNLNRADGMILFIGDGMGLPALTAIRIWKGQQKGKLGEETDLVYDKFPHFGFSKTYNTDFQVPDSAGTGTAYHTGVKTKKRAIGLDGGIEIKNCRSSLGHELESVLVKAKQAGLPVGVVTTTRVTHASPAASYAHVPDRDWEDDQALPADAVADGCKDIAWQLVHGVEIDVVMGGGRSRFRLKTQKDEETDEYGKREDEDLIQAWKDRYGQLGNSKYVISKAELDAIDVDDTDFLLGLFDNSHMRNGILSIYEKLGNPTLAEMTEKAIRILQRKNPDGRFYLFVEGGEVDMGLHFVRAKHALIEGVALDDAIAKAAEITSENTLIVVSADHSHTLSFAGYSPRGTSILGKMEADLRGLPYTTLSFYTGKESAKVVADSFLVNQERPDITNVDTEDDGYEQQSLVLTYLETHGGEDVAIFARGPWSHLFHSVHEENYIAHVMMFAGCIGDFLTDCRNPPLISGSLSGQDAALPARFQLQSGAVPTTPESDQSGAAVLIASGTAVLISVISNYII